MISDDDHDPGAAVNFYSWPADPAHPAHTCENLAATFRTMIAGFADAAARCPDGCRVVLNYHDGDAAFMTEAEVSKMEASGMMPAMALRILPPDAEEKFAELLAALDAAWPPRETSGTAN